MRSRLVCSALPISQDRVLGRAVVVLFVGDDWAEDHHDVEVLDESGRRLAKARLPEGMVGMSRLHELIAEHLDEAANDPDSGCSPRARSWWGSRPTGVRGWRR